MIDRLETIIRDWLNTEFKNPDAMPGPMIKGLAEELNKHRWEIYEHVKTEYDLEDIQMIAESNAVELTKDEESLALHRYQNLEDQNLDALSYIIDEIINERKDK